MGKHPKFPVPPPDSRFHHGDVVRIISGNAHVGKLGIVHTTSPGHVTVHLFGQVCYCVCDHMVRKVSVTLAVLDEASKTVYSRVRHDLDLLERIRSRVSPGGWF